MQIKSESTKKLETCRNKLFNYMEARNIRPYGNIVEFGHGFKIWGAKVVNGKEENKLYYSDLRCIAIWRGNKVGWKSIPKNIHNEIRTKRPPKFKEDDFYKYYKPADKRKEPKYRIKVTKDGVETIYDSVTECAEALGINRTYIYKRAAVVNPRTGYIFEKIPLESE